MINVKFDWIMNLIICLLIFILRFKYLIERIKALSLKIQQLLKEK